MTAPEPGQTATERIEVVVNEAMAGERLDRVLGGRLKPSYSRSFLTELIRRGGVTVDGRVEKPAFRVEVDQRIVARLTRPLDTTPTGENIPLDLLYEDDDVLVINKAAGLMVHSPGPTDRGGTLVNALVREYPEIRHVGEVERPGIVHRLDRHTSGAMVVAKTNKARLGLVQQFKARSVKKEYRALVVGKMPLESDYIDFPVGKHPKQHDRMRVDLEHGKPASTFYEVIERFRVLTYLKVFPLTGRTHQIRLHLSQFGFPVLADSMYLGNAKPVNERIMEELFGSLPEAPLRRHALHAYRISFTHPVDGRKLQFEAPLADDFAAVVDALRAKLR